MNKSKKVMNFLSDLQALKTDLDLFNSLPLEKKDKQFAIVLKEFNLAQKSFREIPIVELIGAVKDVSTILKCDILLVSPIKDLVIDIVTCVEGFFALIDLIKIGYKKTHET